MQVSIETTSGLERRLTVGIPAERIDSEVNARLQKSAPNLRLDGFRPGKVPMKVIKDRFGAGVRQEVIGEVMNQSFYEAVAQENLKPAGQPSIEPKTLDEGKDLEYVATFEVFPEVEEKDYSAVSIARAVAEVADADIDKMIGIFREQQATWSAVERTAASGDKVNIDYLGTKDGESFEGGTAEASDLELGSGSMIPGFEDGIIGMKAGDESVLKLNFPDDYHSEDLKGAAVEFKVTINSISEKVLAELNDDLFVAYGVKDADESKFREEIGKNMARELKQAIKAQLKTKVMDAMLEIHGDIQVPQALVKQEIPTLRNQMVQQFGGAAEQMDMQSLLPDDMFTEQAERRVKLGLILNEFITKGGITSSPEKVKETIDELASTYEDPEEVVNFYYSNQQQMQQIESMVLEDTVVATMLEQVQVADENSSYETVMSPEPPAEQGGE
jgi:trigger factor